MPSGLFSNAACSDSSNTYISSIPIQPYTVYLQYESPSSSSNWVTFPPSAGNIKFFSDENDSSCVTSFDPLSLTLKLKCSDLTKFAKGGTKSFNIRYFAQYTVRDGVPSSVNSSGPAKTFTITINHPCKTNTVTLALAAGSS
jgi:hypothetical protein